MAEFVYTYNKDQTMNAKVDLSSLMVDIQESDVTVAVASLSLADDTISCFFKAQLDEENLATLSGVILEHEGLPLPDIAVPQEVNIATSSVTIPVDISDELRDRSGKLRVHQTSRKIGTVIIWTGEGDDTTDVNKVGGGEPFSFVYHAGQDDPLIKYIDFNIVTNETWLHEGYITWKDCYLDTLDLLVVPRTVNYSASISGTNYNLHEGYLIVPAPPGAGSITINSDITLPDGGLVYMPANDVGQFPTAFFNADWNAVTKRFENITPAYDGTGRYNMFGVEVPLAHFVRKMPLLNSGFIALNSSDTDQLGQGMRLKMVADTNTTISGVGDHDWAVACTMCMHRARTL